MNAAGLQLKVSSLAEEAAWAVWLDRAESAQVAALADPVRRARFVVSRGMRRKVLADLLRRAPGMLAFAEPQGAKPRLLDDGGGWDFNLSHAGDLVALVAGRGAVGVDLEKIRPVREMADLVARYFHPDEAEAWQAVSADSREEAFFVLWSAREAAVKCSGAGLARGMAVTRVDPGILEKGRGLAVTGQEVVQLQRIAAPAGYVLVTAQAQDGGTWSPLLSGS
jgi:phosphopantetheine--protein transferase-like protein